MGLINYKKLIIYFCKKSVDTFSQSSILNRPNRTDLQTTADGSRRERRGRDEG